MGRPRIMLDVRIFHNAKFGALSNRAKLGWIYLLCEAKQQDREGVFPSRAGLLLGAGPFRDCTSAWLEVGLLHYVEAACVKCKASYGDVPPAGAVVHDWAEYQVSRTTLWREENGLGKAGKRPGNVGETPSETPGETEVKPLRARTGASLSLSSSQDVTEGVQGEPFPSIDADAVTFLEGMTGRHIRQSGDKQLAEYDRHITDHGLPAVMAAYRKVAKLLGPKPTAAQLVWSGRKVLEPFVDPKAVAADEREEDHTKAARRRDEAIWKRRMELYQSTGKWDPAWGEAPAA